MTTRRKKGPAMLMKVRERWHCSNLECGCQIVVEISGEIEGLNPRCACGSIMKKKYPSPVFTYLDFLRTDQPSANRMRGSFAGTGISRSDISLAHIAKVEIDKER
jgi:hypothetical protein